ncbi:hypothetical protein ACFQZW_05545 [Lutibacter aestuarii]|uniref:Uncharacterized protein n=1 Tax=Lutibacter aestuarii TaxID=861111 RepID=A0ABW2Z6L9_9FLAO|nr:hypothetical protein [uncultured Lutibacter sp.]
MKRLFKIIIFFICIFFIGIYISIKSINTFFSNEDESIETVTSSPTILKKAAQVKIFNFINN